MKPRQFLVLLVISFTTMIHIFAMNSLEEIAAVKKALKNSKEALINRLKRSQGDSDTDGIPPVPVSPRRGASLNNIIIIMPSSPRTNSEANTPRASHLYKSS